MYDREKVRKVRLSDEELGQVSVAMKDLVGQGLSEVDALIAAGYACGFEHDSDEAKPRSDPFEKSAGTRSDLAELGLDSAMFWIYLKLGVGKEVADKFAEECKEATFVQMKEWVEGNGYSLQFAYGKQLHDVGGF